MTCLDSKLFLTLRGILTFINVIDSQIDIFNTKNPQNGVGRLGLILSRNFPVL